MKFSNLSIAFILLAGGVFAACGTNGGSPSSGTTPGGGDASTTPITGDGGSTIIITGGDGSAPQGTLAIAPLAPVLTAVVGSPAPTQSFTATLDGQTVTGAKWSIDQGALGAIDGSGKFTATGTVGGVAHVTVAASGLTATTTITVNLQSSDNGDPGWTATPGDAGAGGYGGVGGNGPGAPPSATQTGTLQGTPTADATVSILYPYDKTVWPQGLLAPLLQWNAGAHAFDSVYVHISENNFDYKGYFASNTTGAFVNMPIPAKAWNAMAYSNGGEPVTISLVFGQGGSAYGPYTETWTIAQAQLQGTIYYNSYGTALVKNSDTEKLDAYGNQFGAGTLSIVSGATGPSLVAGVNSINPSGDGTGCRVCHTVSADGQSLLTQHGSTGGTPYDQTVFVDLTKDTTGGAGTNAGTDLAFPAYYRDGSLILSSAGGMINGDSSSKLYAMPAATPVTGVTGLPAGFDATLPAFSPDGKLVSFNFWSGSFPNGDGGAGLNADQRSLGLLSFDGKSAFSSPRVVYTPATGTEVTYSSFFPNAAGVVFEVELAKPSGNWGFTWSGNTGELWWLDVATGNAHRLDALNGYDTSGAVYLPAQGGTGTPNHTPAQDVTLNYEPTVNPIASGGYAWVVFTSRRMYGNVAQEGPWVSDPRSYPWLEQVTDKKLWVSAVDLNAKPGTDPSHPAFYLPAQELHAGNARGYWTVEPCRADGQSCATGDQCCGGFCEAGPDGGLECTTQAPACSGLFDKCTTTSDCCGGGVGGIQCINGICTQSTPK